MKLSKRIYALYECIEKGETVADIGTDHGYVPMLLIRNNISPRAIMSDISASSLSKALNTFGEAGLDCSEDDFRVSDGLCGISKGEVDAIIIAGLGGHTISTILDNDIEKTRSFKKLVLQPRKHSGNLRYYLYKRGFDIVKEILIPEGKFMCEIIVATPSCADREPALNEESIEWKYPKEYDSLPNEFVEQRIGYKISSIEEEIVNLRQSKHNRTELISSLEEDRKYLLDILKMNRVNNGITNNTDANIK